MKNPYELIKENQEIYDASLIIEASNLVSNITKVYDNYTDIEDSIFSGDNTHNNVYDTEINNILAHYKVGLLRIYNFLQRSNISESDLNDYCMGIIRKEGLDDSEYYTDWAGHESVMRLMVYYDMAEGINELRGYPVNSKYQIGLTISSRISSHFMDLGFKTVMYLFKAMDIINDPSVKDKSIGQAHLIETLFMWTKVGNLLKINKEV